MLILKLLDPRANVAALGEAWDVGHKHSALIVEMTRRELLDRHVGSFLGAIWAVCLPLLQIAVYVFVFTVIFRGRLGPDDHTGLGYVVYVLSGLIPWIALQDALSRGPASVTGSANLVKQIVFPSEVLPLRVSLAALTTLAVGLALTIVLACFDGRSSIGGILILLPAAVVLHLTLSAGLVYAFSAIGVFLKDLKEIVAFILSIGLFLHPILYIPGQVPNWLAYLFTFSPFSHIIWCFRDALFEARLTRPLSWLLSALTAVACFSIGWRIFRMLKPTFGNAL